MHLSALATVLLLPLAAVAADPLSTTTCTSYLTLTKTITLERAALATVSASNSTVAFSSPTASGGFRSPTTSAPLAASPTGAASALDVAHVAFVAVAGAAVAAFL
jgi:hypothetical protein